jgi:hypothetical protein
MSPVAAAKEQVDLKKCYPELYRAGRAVEEIRAGRGTFLAVDGIGEPGGETYRAALGRLYALAYTAKLALKGAGLVDFSVPPLECLYPDGPVKAPEQEWRWRLMLRLPPEVTGRDLQTVRLVIRERRQVDTSDVKRVGWSEGRALQVLHVGPYRKVGASYRQLMKEATARGLECSGPGHEVYLSDPRRVAPEQLKTIVRIGVRRQRA